MRLLNLLLFFLVIILYASNSFGKESNLIKNSSFELGKHGFALNSLILPGYNKAIDNLKTELDETTKKHGKASLKISNSKACFYKLIGETVELVPGKEYHVSIWMKSSLKDYPVKLIVQSVGKESKWDSKLRILHVNQKWQRYGFSFQVPDSGVHTHYSIRIDSEPDLKRDQSPTDLQIAGSMWLDALQLTEGTEQKEYQPISNLESVIELNKKFPLYNPDEKITGDIKVIEYEGDPTKIVYTYNVIDDYFGTKVISENKQIKTNPGEVVKYPLEINGIKRGGYAIQGEITSLKENLSNSIPKYFAVSESAETTKLVAADEFSLGINMHIYANLYMGAPSTKNIHDNKDGAVDFFEWYAKQGVRWFRAWGGRTAFTWRDLEPERGKFNWQSSDYFVENALKNNIRVLPVLGGSSFQDDKATTHWRPESFPDFILESADFSPSFMERKAKQGIQQVLPPLEDWKNFIRAVVKRYKGKITHYEIMNEPNLYLRPADYVRYLKAAYEAAKSVDPDCKIVGFCSTGDQANLIKFLQESFQLGGLQYCDIVSFHPYQSRLTGTPISAQSMIQDLRTLLDKHGGKNKPLWNTELYFLNTKVKRGYEALIIKGNEIARRFFIDLGEGLQQSIPLEHLFNTKTIIYKNRKQHKPTSLIPSFRYVIYAQLAKYFEGAKPVTRIKWPNQNVCYVVEKDGQLIAIVWDYSEKNHASAILKLPTSKVKILDMFGNTVNTKESDRVLHSVSNEPHYIFWNGSDREEFLNSLKDASFLSTPEILDIYKEIYQ